MWAELKKQLIDQSAHFTWAFIAVLVSVQVWNYAGLPLGMFFLAVNFAVIGFREGRQWPSSRWYDPPLDWAIYSLGTVAAAYAIKAWGLI